MSPFIQTWLFVCMIAWPAICIAGIDSGFERDPSLDDFRTAMVKTLGQGRSFAILIGISDYQSLSINGYDNLPSTHLDVEKMRRFLLEEAGFDYVHVLTEEKVTRTRVDSLMIDYFPSRVKSNDRFIFYWSGHGVARQLENGRKEGYLPLTTSTRNAFGGMISMGNLNHWNGLLSARQTLFILDSCVSGLAGQTAKSGLANLTIEQINRTSHHLLVAATADEQTIAGDKWSGSIFTEAFIKGASGAAAQASNVVSLTELLSYIRRYVATEKDAANWNKTISPQLRDFSASDGEFYFVTKKSFTALSSNKFDTVNIEQKGVRNQIENRKSNSDQECFVFNETKYCE